MVSTAMLTTAEPPGTEEVDALPPCGRDRRAVERRLRLVEAARTLFTEHGFHGAGIAQIAKLSGIKVGQIYRDFTCKEDIVAAIVEADLSEFLAEDALRRAIEDGDAAAVRSWIADLVLNKASRHDAPLLPEIMAESSRNERVAAILRCADSRIRTSLLAALEALLPDGGQGERLAAAADLIVTVMTGLCCRDLASLETDRALMVSRVQLVVDREIGALLAEAGPAVPAS
jgi:AcrR family transcriptional regulator